MADSKVVAPQADPKLIAVAEIARPHGVRGELRVRVFNEASDLLLGKPTVRLALPDGTQRSTKILTVQRMAKGLLMRLADVADRDAAEALRGAHILASRDAFPPVDEGEFYACDIEGARVVLRGEAEDFGRVKTVIEYPTCDVLVIDRAAGGVLEVPLVEPYIGSVDVAAKLIELATIDGLS